MKISRYLYTAALALFMGMAVNSCCDDEGNYNYHDINELTINGLDENVRFNKVAFVDRLVIDPKIESSMGQNNESDYEYEWKFLPFGTDFEQIPDLDKAVVSRERKLDILVTLDPGLYSCFFKVKDKKNSLTTIRSFSLQVKSMTSEGWMVLCNENDKPRMDIIFNVDDDNDLIAHNIWQEAEFNPGVPKKLIYNYSVRQTPTLLVTDKGTYNLDVKDLHAGEDNNLKWRFGASPDKILVENAILSQYALPDLWVIVDNNHDVYTLDNSIDNGYFEFKINKINGKEEFKAAPFIGTSYNVNYSDNSYGHIPAVLYDETNKQFLSIRNNSNYPSVMQFVGQQLFSAQTGRDMVWMESCKSGEIYAILKDPATQQFYFYGMQLHAIFTEPENWWEQGTYTEYNNQDYYGEIKGEGLANATLFACHHLYPYVFYASGNKIYQFDMGHPDTPAREVLLFPGETIKVMKFNPFVAWEQYADWERARNYRLVVATTADNVEPSKSGILRMYDVPDLMGEIKLHKEYKDLGNIVDVAYKERKK